MWVEKDKVVKMWFQICKYIYEYVPIKISGRQYMIATAILFLFLFLCMYVGMYVFFK